MANVSYQFEKSCVFGELLKSRPILQGQDDIDQLKKIFRLCGSPTQDNFPNWDKLPDAGKVRFETTPRHVREEFAQYDTHAGDLMDKLMVLDPSQRLTALEALEHDYFYTAPLPAAPSEFVYNSIMGHSHINQIFSLDYLNMRLLMNLIEEKANAIIIRVIYTTIFQ